MDPDELQAAAGRIGWFHSIDLGQGVRTEGDSELALDPALLPPLAGRSVLDIGAWDGYYSFLAERAGAAPVVALDHYVWGIDWEARNAYWNECQATHTLPDHGRDTTDFWREELPGRRGFDLARGALSSRVEPVVADFMTTDLDALGRFDVVFYFGVLYHMKEPLTALERLRRVTRQVAVIETEAVHIEGHDHDALLQFHAGNDVHVDFGNWYVPTIEAVRALCRAAGFRSVEVKRGPPPPPSAPAARASAGGRRPRGRRRSPVIRPAPGASAPTAAYRAVVHALV